MEFLTYATIRSGGIQLIQALTPIIVLAIASSLVWVIGGRLLSYFQTMRTGNGSATGAGLGSGGGKGNGSYLAGRARPRKK